MAVEREMARPGSASRGEGSAQWSTALGWVIAASALLNGAGIWWGLPRDRGWAVDEVDPLKTIEGITSWFSRGWFDVYPPFQHYLLTAVYGPVFLLDWLGVIDTAEPSGYAWLMLSGRVLSLAMAAGILVAVFECGFQIRRHLFFRGQMLGCVPRSSFHFYSLLSHTKTRSNDSESYIARTLKRRPSFFCK